MLKDGGEASMRWLLMVTLLFSTTTLTAQTPTPSAAPTATASSSTDSSSNSDGEDLPDAPGESRQPQQADLVATAQASFKITGDGVKPCNFFRAMKVVYVDPKRMDQIRKPCSELVYPYQRFLTTDVVIPMTWEQKGYLGVHNLADPANFGTILGISAISIGTDSHSAYGPGLKGFGKIVGVTLLQDATGQFFGSFAIPVIVHEDPRYFRMPHATFPRRFIYCISRTYVAHHDNGTPMPNYAALLNYPIGAVISNLYVPGIESDAASTLERIATGIAADPINNLLTEFLPDVASRVHIRIIFVQRILNNVASGTSGVAGQ